MQFPAALQWKPEISPTSIKKSVMVGKSKVAPVHVPQGMGVRGKIALLNLNLVISWWWM
jgi:hypothetical protein